MFNHDHPLQERLFGKHPLALCLCHFSSGNLGQRYLRDASLPHVQGGRRRRGKKRRRPSLPQPVPTSLPFFPLCPLLSPLFLLPFPPLFPEVSDKNPGPTLTLTTVHSLDVHLQFLRLTELSSAKIAERPCTLRVGGTAVGAVHVQVVETKEELQRHTSTLSTAALVTRGAKRVRLMRLGCSCQSDNTLPPSCCTLHLESCAVWLHIHTPPTLLRILTLNPQGESHCILFSLQLHLK